MTLREFFKRVKCFIDDVPYEEPKKLTEKMKTGATGEQAALEYLLNEGYYLIEKNYRHSHYEIDLIMKDMRCVVFCEVRTRDISKENYKTPAESVTREKQENLMKAASFYMSGYRETYLDITIPPCRFDVVEVYTKDNKVIKINHIKDAFIKRQGYKKKGTGYKSCKKSNIKAPEETRRNLRRQWR